MVDLISALQYARLSLASLQIPSQGREKKVQKKEAVLTVKERFLLKMKCGDWDFLY